MPELSVGLKTNSCTFSPAHHRTAISLGIHNTQTKNRNSKRKTVTFIYILKPKKKHGGGGAKRNISKPPAIRVLYTQNIPKCTQISPAIITHTTTSKNSLFSAARLSTPFTFHSQRCSTFVVGLFVLFLRSNTADIKFARLSAQPF